jgi:hypothetical protein
MVRLRDVQALNRSFRRLAEVQEALLQQMQDLERGRRQQRRWLAPALAAGGLIVGLSLAALAYVAWGGGAQPERIEVQAAAPQITVAPTPVTIQVPEDPALLEVTNLVKADLENLRSDQVAYREQLADLTERLLQSEQEKIDLLKQMAAAAPVTEAAPAVSAPAPVLQVPGGDAVAADPWVGVLNGLLSMDGYSHLRFQEATRVPGAARLEDVVLLEWKSDGLLAAAIRADRAEFELHHMTANLVVRLFDGSRAAGGGRVALPAEGLRLDLAAINARAWLEHFPELSESRAAVAPAAASARADEVKQPAAAGASVRDIRIALDELISQRGAFHYYHLGALGGVDGTVLKLVQINWHDNAGRLVKTIEADTLVVRLHPKGNSVELELRNGAFLGEEGRSPFSSDMFRLYLPRQDLAAWRASGVPYVEAQG